MIELIELEDEDDTEDVEEIQIVDNIGSTEDKKVVPESIEPMVMKDNDNESDDDDIECLDVVEANCGIRSYKPKQYLWMESSPLYQPKVLLMNSLNIKLREEMSVDEVEEAVFEKSPHIRNLFEEEKTSKRKSVVANSPSKKMKPGYEDEMLLLEDPGEDFDEEVLDIQSML